MNQVLDEVPKKPKCPGSMTLAVVISDLVFWNTYEQKEESDKATLDVLLESKTNL